MYGIFQEYVRISNFYGFQMRPILVDSSSSAAAVWAGRRVSECHWLWNCTGANKLPRARVGGCNHCNVKNGCAVTYLPVWRFLSAIAFMNVYECIHEKSDIAAWQKTQKRQSLNLYIIEIIAIIVIIVLSIMKIIAIIFNNRHLYI